MDPIQSSSTTFQLQARSHQRQRLNSYDYISQMPDEVLILILARMPIKYAVATSSLATRWRYLWRDLRQLNFDGRETKRKKYIKQVNSVIKSYNHPTVNDFRISCRLNLKHKHAINKWIKFAVKKKVEFLELDLTDPCPYKTSRDGIKSEYTRSNARCFPMVKKVLPNLKKLILKDVIVRKGVFEAFLKNSPHLEMIAIEDPVYMDHIHLSGQCCNLKCFQIVDTEYGYVRSVNLSDLDLVSFTFRGYDIDLRLAHLPKLNELDLDLGGMKIENVFGRISSCVLSLQSLSLHVNQPEGYLIHVYLPRLPNLKKLKLAFGGTFNDCLVLLDAVLSACPNLETFSIKLICILTMAPIIHKRRAEDATNAHKHLKLVEMAGYKGRKCDFELAAYILQTPAVALKKVVIAIARWDSKGEEAARCSAERIKSIKPQGVELVIV
ncbi:F-box protein At4g09920-like [Rutidosis leptorrhynchoides]|uniref:F-box protein At4g09920-like n=1 Tax=Rutidosis leptorrhynchoides TaxID=125765 RepID=UPI003A996E0C